MAKRFGGTFSPDGRNDANDTGQSPKSGGAGGTPPPRRRMARPDPAGARSTLLFIPAAILAFTAIGDGPVTLALGLIGAGLWTLAAWLTREGLRAEAAFHERKVARRPALPRKMLASVAITLGTGLAAYVHSADVISSALYGVITGALHLAAFGLDPMHDKNAEGIDRFQQDRVARVVDEAEAHLATMTAQIATLRDRTLTARVGAFEHTAREMIRTVEDDPRDLTAARKFLGVYLMGARDATVKFVDVYARNQSEKARNDYEALLSDLEENFAARTEKLLLDDRADLSIEIDVLRERLQREGVRAPGQME